MYSLQFFVNWTGMWMETLCLLRNCSLPVLTLKLGLMSVSTTFPAARKVMKTRLNILQCKWSCLKLHILSINKNLSLHVCNNFVTCPVQIAKLYILHWVWTCIDNVMRPLSTWIILTLRMKPNGMSVPAWNITLLSVLCVHVQHSLPYHNYYTYMVHALKRAVKLVKFTI